ncbi:MAG: hypothetical protein QOK36_1337, partial [Gaiellales bacterium]|nr:hypothetical protein [Gaiellales bacterium]
MSLRSDRLEVGLPTDRRRFVRNAAATALAVTVAPPLVGSAHAQDGPPSLGGSNTFTGNQLYQNSSDAPAITIDNQNPANATSTGSGGAVDVVDFGTSQPTVGLTKRVAPTAASPLLALRNLTGTTGPLITVGDANAIPVPNLAIDEFGQMRWATSGNPSDLAVGRSATGALRIDGAFELVAPPDRRGAVASISTPFNGLLISHANDLDGANYDLVGLFLKS